jgi:hypothetical protein
MRLQRKKMIQDTKFPQLGSNFDEKVTCNMQVEEETTNILDFVNQMWLEYLDILLLWNYGF